MSGSLLINSYVIEILFKLGLLLGLYVLVMRFVLPFVKNERWHDRIQFYAPLVRNLAIVALAIEVVLHLGWSHPWITLGILAAVILLFWAYLSNVLLGTVFKIQRGNLKGQGIKLGEFSGKIVEMKNAKMEVETEKGEVLQIPYAKIVNEVEIKPSAAKYLRACSVVMEVNEKSFKTLQKDVSRQVGLMPYVVDTVLPKIEIIDQTVDQYRCKIVVYTNDDRFVPVIKSRLLKLNLGS